MNALTQRSPPERRTSHRKSVLFCSQCDRTAAVDEWVLTTTDDGETLACPDCGATLTARANLSD
ncbi:hypothetical protein [Halogeometricum limi]|uniref:DUF8106 domain-containing protein n=1 Tax=Halogeometricum limi TaxID=555875 RepID=A0A1I6I5H6_9EURY|nr:hypothetical protein [Halogeometricum limi]SFR61953.1 hypothetical protein SAMN04488124_2856 [Halogeometricum limi]